MFNVFYKKNRNKELFKSLHESQGLSKIQNYIPIYKLFFELTSSNFQNIKFSKNNIFYKRKLAINSIKFNLTIV